MKTSLKIAEPEWTEEGLPYSPHYGDFYFSRENGLEETRHTFLGGNRIPDRFADLGEHQVFSLLETGFGTGLNFLATLREWQQLAPATAKLDYISIEAHPMQVEDLQRALALWPELQTQAQLLLDHYPLLTPGFHCLNIQPGVRLILVFASVENALEQLAGPLHPELFGQRRLQVHAWYLDGFAPRANPEMWQSALFPLVRALSHDRASLATFTAVGEVRRGLQQCGFNMRRTPGYGRKREMLVGELDPASSLPPSLIPARNRPLASWSLSEISALPESVTILGAGIAGVTLARRLAEEGIKVQVIETNAGPMQGASGNAQAALYARLSPKPGDLEDFVLTSLAFASRYYRKSPASGAFSPCGLIQLPRKNSELENMQLLAERLATAPDLVRFLAASELSAIAGLELNSDGLWMPCSGWISPALLAAALLDHPLIHTRYCTSVATLNTSAGRWQALDAEGTLVSEADNLVICTGQAAKHLTEFHWLPTRPIRGQVSQVTNAELAPLRTLVCSHGYLTPEQGGMHSIGATYGLDQEDLSVHEEDHQRNLEMLQSLTGLPDSRVVQGRAGVRCTTPDYLPLCGPAPDFSAVQREFAPLAKDAKRHIAKPGPLHPGLYLNLGFGSRGFCYAPLCGEHLASRMLGRASPLPHYLDAALHPARFIIRNLIRKKS